mgnify:CR=1 FL=1
MSLTLIAVNERDCRCLFLLGVFIRVLCNWGESLAQSYTVLEVSLRKAFTKKQKKQNDLEREAPESDVQSPPSGAGSAKF